MNVDERVGQVAAQVAEHIRQAMAPTEASFNRLVAFLNDSVDGVYVGGVQIPSADLFAAPLDQWAGIASARAGETETEPVAAEAAE